jgi:hypothetical protein
MKRLPFAFIHLPKCGGTSIRQGLMRSGYWCGRPGHMTMDQYIKVDPDIEFFLVQVRHPVDRVISDYNYRSDVRYGPAQYLTKKHDLDIPFIEWLSSTAPARPMVNWFSDIRPSQVYKMEDKSIFQYFYDNNIVCPKLHLRQSDVVIQRALISDDELDIIKEKYKEDFDRFDYEL